MDLTKVNLASLVMWLSTPAGATIAYWLFATFVGQMPKPNGNVWYTWLYNSLQAIAANHSLLVPPAPKAGA